MRRSKLNLNAIFKITQSVISEKSPQSKGRPRIYSDALIISIFLYQILKKLVYREALEEAFLAFGQAPRLSTYHYRVSKLPKQLLKVILRKLAQKLLSKEEKVCFLIADGTGFSYLDLYPFKFFRGLEIRKVKSHVRVVPVIAVTSSGRRIVLSAETGEAYASEIRLLLKVLEDLESKALKGTYFIADKCYDSVEIIHTNKGKQFVGNEFTRLLKDFRIKLSISEEGFKGNILIERFWRTYKYECLHLWDKMDLKKVKEKTKMGEILQREKASSSIGGIGHRMRCILDKPNVPWHELKMWFW